MTRPSFETALAKGEIGEQIVKLLMESVGWVVYRPVTEGAHHFDMLCIKDKRTAVAFDVKAKARMNNLPATGIDQRHFDEYARFSNRHQMPFWLVFVDEMERRVYGNEIAELEKERNVGGLKYPRHIRGGKIRIWPLEAMRHIANLDEAQAESLIALSQRNYGYGAVA